MSCLPSESPPGWTHTRKGSRSILRCTGVASAWNGIRSSREEVGAGFLHDNEAGGAVGAEVPHPHLGVHSLAPHVAAIFQILPTLWRKDTDTEKAGQSDQLAGHILPFWRGLKTTLPPMVIPLPGRSHSQPLLTVRLGTFLPQTRDNGRLGHHESWVHGT